MVNSFGNNGGIIAKKMRISLVILNQKGMKVVATFFQNINQRVVRLDRMLG